MAVSWASKDPNEVQGYGYSWVGRLNGDEISTHTLTVESGTVTLSSVSNTPTAISAKVSGGVVGERAILLSSIETAAGATLEETITIDIVDSLYLNLGPSTSTKRQIIEMAHEECGLSGYEFDLTPEEQFSALRKLDALLAQWFMEGLDLNYNAPATFGAGDLEDYSGIPDAAISATAKSLALRISPNMGKTLSLDAKAGLAKDMSAVRAFMAAAKIKTVPWKYGTPRGAGNRRYTLPTPYLPGDDAQ